MTKHTVIQASEIVVNKIIQKTSSWDNTKLPKYPRGQPEITILKISIPANTKLPLHQHPVINAGILIKGQLTIITQNGKLLNLKEGEPIIEVVDTWHFAENKSDKIAEIIMFYAGAVGTPITINDPL